MSTDSPEPPGSPMRRDDAGEGLDPHDTGVDEESPDSDEDEHGSTIPIEDEEPDPSPDSEESEVERENAETSLDQPSEG